jgi:hypothetical protein
MPDLRDAIPFNSLSPLLHNLVVFLSDESFVSYLFLPFWFTFIQLSKVEEILRLHEFDSFSEHIPPN